MRNLIDLEEHRKLAAAFFNETWRLLNLAGFVFTFIIATSSRIRLESRANHTATAIATTAASVAIIRSL